MLKKLKIYPRVLIVFFVVLSIVGILFVRGNEYCMVEGNYETVQYEEYIYNIKGYNNNNDYFKVSKNDLDPQLVFDFRKCGEAGINAFKLELSEEIDLSKIQVFFGRNELMFTEHDSKFLEERNSNVIEIVSVKPFKFLRLDINNEFQITNTSVADSLKATEVKNNVYYVIAILLSAFISIILSYIKKVDTFIVFIKNYIVNIIKNLWKNKLNSFAIVLLIIGELVISFFIERFFYVDSEYLNRQRIVIMFAIMFIATVTFAFRKNILSKLHIYFFVIAMIIGISHVIIAPPVVGISWDDEIHYGKTSYLSWMADGKISVADEDLIINYNKTITGKKEYNVYGRADRVNELCALNNRFGEKPVLVNTENYTVSLHYIAYTPTALAIGCARGLGLSYTHTFMVGKLMNIFCYSLIISLAIWIIKDKGKILITLIGLIPTSIFLASSYSYDWWVISFCILGYAYFLSKIQKKEAFTNIQFVGLMLIMLIALLPKAIYFPILLPMMLLKKDKYKNSKFCRTLVVISIIALIATFIFPILFATSTGDARGGSDVDAMKQIAFILGNPLEYTNILLTYLNSYLSLDTAKGYITMMGYYGTGTHYVVCLIIIALGALIDNGRRDYTDKNYMLIKGMTVFCSFASIVLVITALYVSFTSVGYHTISGCQARYIMPLLFPTIYCLSDLEVNIKRDTKSRFVSLVVCVMAYVFLSAIFTMCGKYY